jgi:hypothetical protein
LQESDFIPRTGLPSLRAAVEEPGGAATVLYLRGISTGQLSVAHQPPAAMARMTKLVLTFLESKTAQQFSGWLYLVGREENFAAPGSVKRDGQEGVPKDQREDT